MFCPISVHWSTLQRKMLSSSQLIFHFISKESQSDYFSQGNQLWEEQSCLLAPTQGWIGFILFRTLTWKERPSVDERKTIASAEHFRSVQHGWCCGWFSKFSPDIRATSTNCTAKFENHQAPPSVILVTYSLDFWSFPLLRFSPTPQAFQQW